ncbi:MAG: anti-sigma factor antagonist [Lachnospiraceae bacterium]|nr:anti-sigma factor antagonist [Lachnospiraceae bacterium]
MSEEFTIEELREEVNPVYNTAQSCLQIVSSLGDQDSDNLRKVLGFSVFGADSKEKAKNIPPEILEMVMKLQPVFRALVESRFFSFNNFFKAVGARQVVDLPCGYTSRGIKLANSGIRFWGLDLPAVIDAMTPAIKEVIGDNKNISYSAVDATNYSSLRKALESAEGELYITTEGLLMYFTQSELETVFGNIRKLLLEFGGKWITLDNELTKAEKETIEIVTSGFGTKIAESISASAAGTVAKTTIFNNVFFDADTEKAKKFVSDMGFDLELIPLSRYLPDPLISFKDYPEDIRKKASESLGSANFWVMTARSEGAEKFTCSSEEFKADVKFNEGTLHVALAGRLDTISAPELLALYKEAEAKGQITNICIDMKNLEYISSAGLRVLLIMRKALQQSEEFSLININTLVQEIIETTGFDTIFC